MSDTFYFSHDYNTRSDEKIKKLIYEHGFEGYGLYWAIIEELYQNANAMRFECERIAYELRTDKERIASIINDFDLFVVDGEFFHSTSIEKRLKMRIEKSRKASESAKARWSNANAKRTHSERNAIKESKGKENKGNVFKEPTVKEIQSEFSELDAQRFHDFYSSKGWMIGKNKMKDWKAAARNWMSRDKTVPSQGKLPKATLDD
jgi:uncharacterized protein YdaU (DUF1376 family)